jgi:mRNA-degrading endonuclease RelE of RelBE toxin-antitoxin system
MAANPGEEWRVKVLPEAQKELDRLPDSVRLEALEAIQDLAEAAFPPGSILMRGYSHSRRIKFYGNQYRILYHVSESQKTVYVFRVRPRADAYRGL